MMSKKGLLFLMGLISASCGPSPTSKTASVTFNMSSIFVIGTWGRNGADDGIEDTITRLREALAPLGVPVENIYTQSWSSSRVTDDVPGDVPATDTHMRRFGEKLRERGLAQPGYLGLIGHSFGGWASARISTSLSRKPDSVFLLDPVIMLGYRDRETERTVRATYGKSYFQEESIIDIDPCISGAVVDAATLGLMHCDANANASCGQIFHGLSDGNERVRWQRESDGATKKVNCTLLGREKRRISHISIDNDGYLRETIVNHILRDVARLKNSVVDVDYRWVEMPGLGSDVGAFDQNQVAVLGMGEGNRPIYRWNADDWTSVPGGATSIDIEGDGTIWAVNDGGDIWRSQNQGFVQVPGKASDISVSPEGTVWVISQVDDDIYRLDPQGFVQIPGKARRISAGPAGTAVAVTALGDIFRFDGESFSQMPGKAQDVGVGADGSIWIIGVEPNTWGFDIRHWNGREFVLVEGGGIRIDVDNLGQPWLVNNVGGIYKANRL